MSHSPTSAASAAHYDAAAYQRLFTYARRQLLRTVADDALPIQQSLLAAEMYPTEFELDALLEQAYDQFASVYKYDTDRNKLMVSSRLANTPVYLRRDLLLDAANHDVMVPFARWVAEHHMQVMSKVNEAKRHAHLVARRGRELVFALDAMFNFIDTAYDGLALLYLLPNLGATYTDFIHLEQNLATIRNQSDEVNLWLWHAHVLSAALWTQQADTVNLDRLIDDVLEHNILPDFNLLA